MKLSLRRTLVQAGSDMQQEAKNQKLSGSGSMQKLYLLNINRLKTFMKLFVRIGFFLLFPNLLMAQSQSSRSDSVQLLLANAQSDTARMNIYDQQGWYYAEINRDSSLFYFEKELPIARKLKLRLYEADALNGMGYALHQLGNYPASLESYLEAQKIASDVSSENNAWNLTNNAWNTSKSADPKNARLDLLGWIESIQYLAFS